MREEQFLSKAKEEFENIMGCSIQDNYDLFSRFTLTWAQQGYDAAFSLLPKYLTENGIESEEEARESFNYRFWNSNDSYEGEDWSREELGE